METQYANAFTLVQGKPLVGISVLDDAVVLRRDDTSIETPLSAEVLIRRDDRRGRLLCNAAIKKVHDKNYSLIKRDDWNGMLLYIPDAASLDFEGDALELGQHRNPTLWSGAEVRSDGVRKIRQLGLGNDTQKVQFIAVDRDKPVLIVDCHARVRVYCYDGSCIAYRAATPVDCVLAIGYILRSGTITDKALVWAAHAMERLCKLPGATEAMQRATHGLLKQVDV